MRNSSGVEEGGTYTLDEPLGACGECVPQVHDAELWLAEDNWWQEQTQ